ncbi:hypothetical protein LCGC14_1677420 [marine sediment metagenome]|uniref:Uncharacterized protein n=1 Tax=marine sediment metagenome TaxID=412755 RepID=A0A0F9HQ36_9ZZZZ
MQKGVIKKTGDRPARKESVTKDNIKKITIDPRLDIIKLLKLLYEAEERDEIEVLKISFDSKWFTKDPRKTIVGKIKYVSSNFFIDVPPQTVKFGEDYSVEELLKDMRELDNFLVGEYDADNYTIENLYPTSLYILDRAQSKSIKGKTQEKIIKFGKVRQIDKKSPVGQMLRGGQIMPLDAVDLHNAKLDKDLLWISRGRPSDIEKDIEDYIKGGYIINAVDIKQYTDHLHPHIEEHDGQHCRFTIITTCPVIIKEIPVKIITVDKKEGSCEMIFPLPIEEEKTEKES